MVNTELSSGGEEGSSGRRESKEKVWGEEVKGRERGEKN